MRDVLVDAVAPIAWLLLVGTRLRESQRLGPDEYGGGQVRDNRCYDHDRVEFGTGTDQKEVNAVLHTSSTETPGPIYVPTSAPLQMLSIAPGAEASKTWIGR